MLLDDDVVLEYLNENYSFFQVASKLNVPVELLDFKFKILKQKGYKLVSPINRLLIASPRKGLVMMPTP